MAHVLFVCTHNAGRSQMAQALFEQAAQGRHAAASAGTAPADHVHPEVIEVMRELGIDLANRRPQLLTDELADEADVVVTMGCGERCPFIPGKRYIDWELEDPKGRPVEAVRVTRDEIARRVGELLVGLDADRPTPAGGARANRREPASPASASATVGIPSSHLPNRLGESSRSSVRPPCCHEHRMDVPSDGAK